MDGILKDLKVVAAIAVMVGSIWLMIKGILRLDEHIKLREKKLELKMREMEAESEERILNKQEKNDFDRSATTIVGNLSIGGAGSSVSKGLLMTQIKCVQCGGSIEPGSKFCRFCGTAVPDLTQKAEVRVETVNKARIRREELNHELEKKKLEEEAKQQKAENWYRILWGIILVAMVLGMIWLLKK